MKKDFLFELGSEELPPKSLKATANLLKENIANLLKTNELSYDYIKFYATPRRLALFIKDLSTEQKDVRINRKGPPVNADKKAISGFVKALNVNIKDLDKITINNIEYYCYSVVKKGPNTKDLLVEIIKTALKNLTANVAMRWGDNDEVFIRPVHWIVALLNSEVLNIEIFNLKSSNITRGLRFTKPNKFIIKNASDYEKVLQNEAKITADFDKRKQLIRNDIVNIAKNNNAILDIDEDLLEEVTALVEYPKAFIATFDKDFLKIPKEVLISAMSSHQKYFHLLDKDNKLLSYFIAVANIESKDISMVIKGNERVIKPRLSDAKFFYNKDCEKTLAIRVNDLKKVMFMKSLGSLYDKVDRLTNLVTYISPKMNANTAAVKRAAYLSKSDLITDMVVEFPDLQGIMGYYYALNDNEDNLVAAAIKYQYHPRFANDLIPESIEAKILAISDKLDTIVGIYGIGQIPSGNKDPYALRRLALGILRILIESKIDINLYEVINESKKTFANLDLIASAKIYKFMLQRLKTYYLEKGITTNVFEAVYSLMPESPYDFHQRIVTVNEFSKSNKAKSLVEANKRIANMIKKQENTDLSKIDTSLFEQQEEKELFIRTSQLSADFKNYDYKKMMLALTDSKQVIDNFFDNVMVNVADEKIKINRLSLLYKIRIIFLKIADISFLH